MRNLWCVSIIATKWKSAGVLSVEHSLSFTAGTEEHALGYGYKKLKKEFPEEDGWKHNVHVVRLTKTEILKFLETVDE